jgi:hypothetical protein
MGAFVRIGMSFALLYYGIALVSGSCSVDSALDVPIDAVVFAFSRFTLLGDASPLAPGLWTSIAYACHSAALLLWASFFVSIAGRLLHADLKHGDTQKPMASTLEPQSPVDTTPETRVAKQSSKATGKANEDETSQA